MLYEGETVNEPLLDKRIYQIIKEGKGTFDDILSLKKELNVDAIQLGRAIERLTNYDLIKRQGDRFIINNKFVLNP